MNEQEILERVKFLLNQELQKSEKGLTKVDPYYSHYFLFTGRINLANDILKYIDKLEKEK